MRFAVYRCRPVNIQDRVDHRQQRDQLGLCHWYRLRTAWRQREPPYLQYRLAARTKNSCRLVLAVAIDKRKAPDSGVNLHGNIPAVTNGNSLTNGRVLGRPFRPRAGSLTCFVLAVNTTAGLSKTRPPRLLTSTPARHLRPDLAGPMTTLKGSRPDPPSSLHLCSQPLAWFYSAKLACNPTGVDAWIDDYDTAWRQSPRAYAATDADAGGLQLAASRPVATVAQDGDNNNRSLVAAG